jgi:O-antigen ligase
MKSRAWIVTSLLACAAGGLLALSGSPAAIVMGVSAVAVYALFAVVSIREPLILAIAVLVALEVLPPFYFEGLGDTPVYVSFLLLPLALAVVVVRFPDIRWEWDPIGRGLAAFLTGTALSIPFSFWLSGTSAGITSLSRWLLLSHAATVYFLVRCCRHQGSGGLERQTFRVLLLGSIVSAAYGIVDFVWPIPLPHPAADQFIWLEGAILRRAQGVFHESSNFANFCGLFLVAASCAFLARRERILGVSRSLLIVFTSVLSLAVLVAFSRSTWASVLTALLAFFLLGRLVQLPRGLAVAAALVVPICLMWMVSPDLWDYLVSGRVGRLFEILDDPNSATSGRFDTWIRVLSILQDHPHYLLFGIGYKTLGVTRLFHGEIVTDNGYLSLLLETGFAGLAGFLLWSGAILKVFLRLSRSVHELPAFWAAVLFSIWCGEFVQLLAADATTYWRNIAVLSALMALTLNLAERCDQPAVPA